MVSEHKEVKHPYQMVFPLWIIDSVELKISNLGHCYSYYVEDLNFENSLVFESLLVLDDLYCNNFFRQFALTFDHLSKCPLAKQILNFISIRKMLNES